MMSETLFWKKLAKEEHRSVSGWLGRCMGIDLPTKVKYRLYAYLEEVPYLQSKSLNYDDLVDKRFFLYNEDIL